MIRIFLILFFVMYYTATSFTSKKINNIRLNKGIIRVIPKMVVNMNDFDPFNPLDIPKKINSFNQHVLIPFNHDFVNLKQNFIQNSNCWIHDQNNMIGKEIVLKISSLLPNFDSVGHKILHANNEFILNILTSHFLSEMVQKNLVLLSIKLAQYGDNFGSSILELYYKIVDICL